MIGVIKVLDVIAEAGSKELDLVIAPKNPAPKEGEKEKAKKWALQDFSVEQLEHAFYPSKQIIIIMALVNGTAMGTTRICDEVERNIGHLQHLLFAAENTVSTASLTTTFEYIQARSIPGSTNKHPFKSYFSSLLGQVVCRTAAECMKARNNDFMHIQFLKSLEEKVKAFEAHKQTTKDKLAAAKDKNTLAQALQQAQMIASEYRRILTKVSQAFAIDQPQLIHVRALLDEIFSMVTTAYRRMVEDAMLGFWDGSLCTILPVILAGPAGPGVRSAWPTQHGRVSLTHVTLRLVRAGSTVDLKNKLALLVAGSCGTERARKWLDSDRLS